MHSFSEIVPGKRLVGKQIILTESLFENLPQKNEFPGPPPDLHKRFQVYEKEVSSALVLCLVSVKNSDHTTVYQKPRFTQL